MDDESWDVEKRNNWNNKYAEKKTLKQDSLSLQKT